MNPSRMTFLTPRELVLPETARSVSTTAPQSLHLFNSEFSLSTSLQAAGSILAEGESNLIPAAFARILCRVPTQGEARLANEFLEEQQKNGATEQVALAHLCLTLFNSNEFIFVD